MAQINFDGKLLTDLGGFGKIHRVAVVLVREDEYQILCISKAESGTGKTGAGIVYAALLDWGVVNRIIACGFDTTSSNTGKWAGSCVLLQQLLEHQIAWMACKHHINELMVGAAFKEIFGDTSAPDATLFKILKQQWNSLDLSDLKLPEIPQVFQKDVADLLAFIDRRLEPDMVVLLPRGDYKEFLELAKVFLGGSIDRKKGYTYTIQVPGADHHARWMSKSIYTLKLRLLLNQFSQYDIHWQTRKKVRYSRQ